MIFGSNPSVYTLPGTWEAQPMVPVELIFSTVVAISTLGVIAIVDRQENHKVWDNNEIEFISIFKLEDIIK